MRKQALRASDRGSVGTGQKAGAPDFEPYNPNPVVEIDESGRVSRRNPAAASLFPDMETRGSDHPWIRGWSELLRTRGKDGITTQRRDWECDGRWYRQDAVIMAGSPGQARIYGVEITDRVQAERKARESRNILTSILESTTDSVFIKDTSLRMVLCNSVLAAMVGKRPEETVGKTDIENGWDPDLVHGNPSKGIKGWEQDDRAVLAGSTARPEQERQVVSGEVRLFDTIKTPLRDESGAIIGLLGVSRDITERLKTERSLREARELLQIFIDHAPAAIAMLDRQLRYIAASRRWLADYRISRSEIIGHGHYEVFPEIPDRWKEIHRRSLAGAVERCEKDPFLRADGTVDWVRWEIHPWRNAGGEIGGICIFSELITEREELQQNLLREKALLLTVVNSLPDLVYVKDRESRFILANRAIAEVLGVREPSELVGKTDFDFHPREVAEGFLADERRVMDEGRSLINQELSTELTSGSLRWGLSSKVPFYDESGRVAGLVGVSRDITGHRLAEEKQQEQAALLDIAADAIFVRDMQHRIVYWNKGAEKIYGWTVQEAMGRNADELLGTTAPDSKKAYEVVLEKGEWLGEFQRKSKSGAVLDIEGRWTLVRDERGNPKGILAVNTDVTERRSIQLQLLRVQRLESIGTLAGGIAHDLNNVLTPILMGLEGLSLRHPDQGTRRILELMKTTVLRGASIVRQVLSFARGIEGERSEVQLKHVLREIAQIIEETFPRSIEIRSRVPKDLPPVWGDVTQIHQVLMNLCVNARDAMPDGGTLTLSAESVRLEESYAQTHVEAKPIAYVVLHVEDTGGGMGAEILDKIFDPFFTTKDPGKGTGLGLATCRSIVKSHAGFINVYSEVGKGSSFGVYLPAMQQESVESGEREQPGIPMGGGELILVVDDEPAIREITRQILDSYAYRTVTAANGTEALAIYAARRTDIRAVITDMMMPRMDGASTIRALRELDPRLPIIATSGLTARGQVKEAQGLGVNAFLSKPYAAETLLERLHEVLSEAPR